MSKMSHLHESINFSKQLYILHKHISENNLPVEKIDSFDEQCILLEQYIGADIFNTYCKKMRMVNVLSGCFAFPVLLLIIGIYIYSKVNTEFDVFKYIVDHPVTYILGSILIILVLCLALYFNIMKRKLYGDIYLNLKSKLNII